MSLGSGGQRSGASWNPIGTVMPACLAGVAMPCCLLIPYMPVG